MLKSNMDVCKLPSPVRRSVVDARCSAKSPDFVGLKGSLQTSTLRKGKIKITRAEFQFSPSLFYSGVVGSVVTGTSSGTSAPSITAVSAATESGGSTVWQP